MYSFLLDDFKTPAQIKVYCCFHTFYLTVELTSHLCEFFLGRDDELGTIVSKEGPAETSTTQCQESQESPAPSASPSGSPSITILDSDIAIATRRKLRDEEKLKLLKSPRFEEGQKFPSVKLYGRERSFQASWLHQFPWLVYSPSQKGGFCRP